MDKRIAASIGGRPFDMEEQAYQVLQKYLADIAHHFNKVEDEEIVADIEERVGEKLAERQQDATKVITQTDIEWVIESLGTVAELTEAELGGEAGRDSASTAKRKGSNRLFRDPDDCVIAGVAAGIAARFDIDPTWLRVAFVVTTFMGGFGIIAYLVFWIAMPVADSPMDKVEMRGYPITLQKIEELKKKVKVEEVKETGKRILPKITEFFRQFFDQLGRLVKAILPLFLKLIGFVLIIAGLAGLVGVIVAFITSLFGLHWLTPWVPSLALAIIATAIPVLPGAMLVTAMVLFMLIILGVAMFNRRWPISGTGAGILLLGLIGGIILLAVTALQVLPHWLVVL